MTRLVLGIVLFVGCADRRGEEPAPTTEGEGPAPTTRIGFIPGDLTTNLAPGSTLQVALTDLGSAPVTDAELEAALAVVTADGSPVPGAAVMEPDEAIPRVGFRPDAPMADGWHEVRFTAPAVRWTFVSDRRSSMEVEADVFVARVRVGSQPFLRGTTVCGGAGERETLVELDFSEAVVSGDAGAVRVLDETDTVACAVSLAEETEAFRFECPGLDPTGPITLELPPLASTLGVTLQAGPDGGAPPARYEITPTSLDGAAGCIWYALVPER